MLTLQSFETYTHQGRILIVKERGVNHAKQR